MPAQTSKTPGDGSGTLSYTLASDSFDIESVYVSVDATTATGPVTAELTVRDQSGVVIARKKQAATIPAGQAGSATWALRLDDEGAASAYTTVEDEGVALPPETILNFVGAGVTAADDPANARTTVTIPGGGGGGIQFDTYPQSGDWLDVETTGVSPDTGYGLQLRWDGATTDDGGIELDAHATDAGFHNELAMGQYNNLSVGIALLARAGLHIFNTSGGVYLLRQSSADNMQFESHLGGFTFVSNSSGFSVFAAGNVDLASTAGDVILTANGSISLQTGSPPVTVLRIDADGSIHGPTGGSIVWDL